MITTVGAAERRAQFAQEDGQGLSEYALILALVAIVAVAALTLFGGSVTSLLSTAAQSV